MEELRNYLSGTIIFTSWDAMKVVGLMGAVFKKTASESKQGGGDTLSEPRWPDGTIIHLSEMLAIEGTLRMFNEWHGYASFGMHPGQSGPTFYATVEGHSVSGRDPCATLWNAALASGMKPHAYVGFRASKPLSAGMRADTAEPVPDAAEPGAAGDRAVEGEADPAGGVQQAEVPAGEDVRQRPVDLGNDVWLVKAN